MADEPKGTEEEQVEGTPEAVAEEKPKPARKPRAKKTAEPKAEAAEATEAPADEKPKPARKPRAKKPAEPKAEEAVVEETPAEEEKPAAEEKKPAEKPAPARRTRKETPERVVVRARAKYVRTSARKARLVCDHIRGKDVAEARAILTHTNRAVAEAWSKLLESAVANAAENHSLDGEDLRVAFVAADEGPTLKRFRPRAMGRATKIRKRTSHLSIGLEPKE
jgi:large subunit ribosomal protein L22